MGVRFNIKGGRETGEGVSTNELIRLSASATLGSRYGLLKIGQQRGFE